MTVSKRPPQQIYGIAGAITAIGLKPISLYEASSRLSSASNPASQQEPLCRLCRASARHLGDFFPVNRDLSPKASRFDIVQLVLFRTSQRHHKHSDTSAIRTLRPGGAYWRSPMPINKILLLCLPLALAGCNAIDASAGAGYGEYTYHDVLRPHGRSRTMAAAQADSTACYSHLRTVNDRRYRGCMSAHGWKLLAYAPRRAAPQEDDDSAYVAPSDSTYAHDGYSDAMQTQQMINDMNTGIAAEAAATAAASQANADAALAATQ
jgi:hypothetical protein